jgi:hypothetical protein
VFILRHKSDHGIPIPESTQETVTEMYYVLDKDVLEVTDELIAAGFEIANETMSRSNWTV